MNKYIQRQFIAYFLEFLEAYENCRTSTIYIFKKFLKRAFKYIYNDIKAILYFVNETVSVYYLIKNTSDISYKYL